MARDKVTTTPEDLPERVASHALDAARKYARGNMNDVKEMVVMVRLEDDQAATAMGGSDEIDGATLASMLLSHFKVVMEAMGKDVQIGFLEKEIGRG